MLIMMENAIFRKWWFSMVVKRAKYGNIKTKIDGITFDSRAESEYYRWLKQNKDVVNIECQPKFTLQPSFRKNNKTIRAITYIADFRVFYRDGHTEIIDVKGVETDSFRIKAKLFEFCYPDLSLILIKGNKYKNG